MREADSWVTGGNIEFPDSPWPVFHDYGTKMMTSGKRTHYKYCSGGHGDNARPGQLHLSASLCCHRARHGPNSATTYSQVCAQVP